MNIIIAKTCLVRGKGKYVVNPDYGADVMNIIIAKTCLLRGKGKYVVDLVSPETNILCMASNNTTTSYGNELRYEKKFKTNQVEVVVTGGGGGGSSSHSSSSSSSSSSRSSSSNSSTSNL